MLLHRLIAVLSIAEAAGSVTNSLVGTWTTKSRKVFTGPGFYDPVNDQFIEPELPGISYSFTPDGWWESAYYRAGANAITPNCPTAVMQWQHGKYVEYSNGSLSLTPISTDGRQQISDPCEFDSSLYERYTQAEFYQRYEIVLDEYHNVARLNLYQFDGSPMIPMYLAYNPTPEMLPTQTLNPTSTPTTKMRKRDISAAKEFFQPTTDTLLDPDRWWWFGVGMTTVGTLLYVVF